MKAWAWPRAVLVRVIDGDTIEVDLDRGFHDTTRMILRLAGIDTDELHAADPAKRAHAAEAKARVAALLPAGAVCSLTTAKPAPADKYGRWLATVFLPDGTELNALLVREGLARSYDGGAR